MKKVYLLTSSRADYGIYRPLARGLETHSGIELHLVAFGTHLDEKRGATIAEIKSDGFSLIHELPVFPKGDTQLEIARCMAETLATFNAFWSVNSADAALAIVLGDRSEMYAAAISTNTFDIPIAHLHGGETTLGAKDNAYRHGISLLSQYHFCATHHFQERLIQLLDNPNHIYNVGAPGLDNLLSMELFDRAVLAHELGIDPDKKWCSFTFHPETVHPENNQKHAEIIGEFLRSHPEFEFIVSLPNADVANTILRHQLEQSAAACSHVHCFEHLGTLRYFSVLKHAAIVVGNSSSGIIEAASFHVPVINLGERQRGRYTGPNVIHCAVVREEIEQALHDALRMDTKSIENPYFNGGASKKIVEHIERILHLV